MVGTLQPESYVCIAAIQNGIFDLANANMYLVRKAFRDKPTLLLDHYVSTQDAIEGNINSEMQDSIRDSKRNFRKLFEGEHSDFASSKSRRTQYKEEKIRHVLQVEQTLLCEDLRQRFNWSTAVSFYLKVDDSHFTPRRWLEIFFDSERTPTDERDTLKKFLLKDKDKDRDDFSLTHVFYSAGEMGARSVIGRFAREIFDFAEKELKKLNLDAERKAGAITEAILQARNPDRNLLEVFLRSLLIDHFTKMQMFTVGGMLSQIARQLPPKSYTESPALAADEAVAKAFKETLSKESILARARGDKACKLALTIDARVMINSFVPMLVADIKGIINTMANILAVASYLKKSSQTQSITAVAVKSRERAQSILRTSNSRLDGRNSPTGLPLAPPPPPPLPDDIAVHFKQTHEYFSKFLSLIDPKSPPEPEKSLLSSFASFIFKDG